VEKEGWARIRKKQVRDVLTTLVERERREALACKRGALIPRKKEIIWRKAKKAQGCGAGWRNEAGQSVGRVTP